MIATIAVITAIAEKKSSPIAAIIAIIWKPDVSAIAATTIAEIDAPFHIVEQVKSLPFHRANA